MNDLISSRLDDIKKQVGDEIRLLIQPIASKKILGVANEYLIFDIQKDFENFLLLTIKAKNSNDLEFCAGWLEGNIFGLLLNLEQELNIDLRPNTQIKKQQTTCKLMIAVNLLEEKDLAILEKITNNFINNFAQEKITLQPAEIKMEYCKKEKPNNKNRSIYCKTI